MTLISRRFKNIIFDLDGTLIDSADEIISCLQRAYEVVPHLGIAEIQETFIGPPLTEIIRLATPGISTQDTEQVVRKFRQYYDRSDLRRTVLKNHAADTLTRLASIGIEMYVVTNKPDVPTKKILKNLQLSCFRDIITPDMLAGMSMNKSEMVSYVRNKWHCAEEETLLVGDTASDAYAARDNGIASAIVLNGYGDRSSIGKSSPEYCINDLSELQNIV